MVAKLIDIKRADYTLRNAQSRIIARILRKEFPNVWNGLLDNLTEKLQSDEEDEIEMALRSLELFLDTIEEEHEKKLLSKHIGRVIPALFSAMVSDAADSKIREKVLNVFNLCLQMISWADGKD